MPMRKQALGKGLGALIGKHKAGESDPGDHHERIRDADIDLIVPSPLQPRTHFFEAPLDELVESIRQHGVVQPLIVRPVDGRLELIAGERRWRASRKLGLATVPVIEREASDRDVLEIALVENLQREDLNPIEEAIGYSRLAREFKMKQEEIASRVGKSRASVANAIRLLELPPEVQTLVAQGRISVGHAKAVLSIKDDDTRKLAAERILKGSLTVRAAERLAHELGEGRPKPKPGRQSRAGATLDPHIAQVRNLLRDHFATQVHIQHGHKRGKIELEYYGENDLQRILDLLGLSAD
jgi:ParB family chromosome partitioning protein